MEISGTAESITRAALAYAEQLQCCVVITPLQPPAYWRMLDRAKTWFAPGDAEELCNNIACVLGLDDEADVYETIRAMVVYRMGIDSGLARLACRDADETSRDLARVWRGEVEQ